MKASTVPDPVWIYHSGGWHRQWSRRLRCHCLRHHDGAACSNTLARPLDLRAPDAVESAIVRADIVLISGGVSHDRERQRARILPTV